jgi:hypothetical protein
MTMKRFIVVAGGVTLLLCAASAATAEPRDSVERAQRLDTDAIRDDVRTNRLQVPAHPISAMQPLQPEPSPKGKAKSKKGGGNRN